MSVQVLLVQDYPVLGHVGDMVLVKPGFARNFLFPRGIAIDCSSAKAKQFKHKISAVHAKRAKLKQQAQEFAKKLSDNPLEFVLKTGESGKSFGSITAKDIESAFIAKGYEINKKQIKLLEPLKNAGEYKVEVKVHAEVSAMVLVKIAIESQAKKLEGKEEDKKKVSKKSAGKKPSKKDVNKDSNKELTKEV